MSYECVRMYKSVQVYERGSVMSVYEWVQESEECTSVQECTCAQECTRTYECMSVEGTRVQSVSVYECSECNISVYERCKYDTKAARLILSYCLQGYSPSPKHVTSPRLCLLIF